MIRLIVICLLCHASLGAVGRRYDSNQDQAILLREMRDSLAAARHDLNNQETELQMLSERIDNQEATLSSIRQQTLDTNQGNKELVRESITTVDSKLSQIEGAIKTVIADLSTLNSALSQYKMRQAELEQALKVQSQNIDNLQAAFGSLTQVLQKEQVASTEKSYRIKSGDSLEKIARAHNTSIKALKEANHLTTDRIIVGQTLKIP